MLGIDEAGRGPTMGAMVYGTCWCPVSKADVLAQMGFADSKVLSEEQRAVLFEDIKKSDILGWAVDTITAEDISQQMLRRQKVSLNVMSHDSAIGLIQKALDQGVNVQEVYVDTVGTPSKYEEKLKGFFPGIRSITVAKKADSLYPIVSAASICAKVTRDVDLANFVFKETELADEISREFGSGYPADPATKKWLADNLNPVFGWPSVVRFSWATCKKIIESEGIPMEWDDDDEEEQEARGGKAASQKMTQFFAASSNTNSVTSQQSRIPLNQRFSYFKNHHMHVATSFSDSRRT